MSFYVYMVRCADGSLYTGITNDLEKRVDQHNGLQPGGAKYTRSHRPVVLVHSEEYATKPAALKREIEIKALNHQEKIALLGRASKSQT